MTDPAGSFVAQAYTSIRTSAIVSAVVGIVVGIIVLVWPGATVVVLAWLFGIALIIGGLFRIVAAFTADALSTGNRWLLGILGVVVVVAGIICLIHPVSTAVFIAIFIGIAWIISGIHDLIVGISGRTIGPRWLPIVGGIISVIAGIVILFLPGVAIGTFIVVSAIMLIVVSIVSLFTLPPKISVA
ncbi:HdeD family acid-resistance protein [Nakamurella lactea]|uniref:HdeD family acid-resistance protein n=1 Tax=Nakamurella lactea TaxID=459515 RepID=UPI00041BBF58|nr:DUF308 domain-containing protein [Nakamurella lactea]